MNQSKKEELYLNIYREYYQDIFCYALKLTKNNKSEAEDIVQDSLVRAWNGLDKLKNLKSAKYWLITIVKREFLRKINHNKIMHSDDVYEVEYQIEHNSDATKEYEMNEILKFVNMLDEPYKEVLILQGIYGYKIKEISSILKINENTVSTRIFRARHHLENLLNTFYLKEKKKEESYYSLT